jgi:hypothetical protein
MKIFKVIAWPMSKLHPPVTILQASQKCLVYICPSVIDQINKTQNSCHRIQSQCTEDITCIPNLHILARAPRLCDTYIHAMLHGLSTQDFFTGHAIRHTIAFLAALFYQTYLMTRSSNMHVSTQSVHT